MMTQKILTATIAFMVAGGGGFAFGAQTSQADNPTNSVNLGANSRLALQKAHDENLHSNQNTNLSQNSNFTSPNATNLGKSDKLSENSTLIALDDIRRSAGTQGANFPALNLAQNDTFAPQSADLPAESSNSAIQTYTLDSVVISAAGYEQEIKHAPASISIISKEDILNKPIRDLGDIVQEVPGVSMSIEKTGASSINIRGMGSSYTLILIDGKRVNMSRGFDGRGFDSTSGAIPPASMIERVEVIRGPASTIYGSDAMGGVINIITKKSTDKVSASVGFETRLQEHHDTWGNAQGVNGNIFLPLGERFSLNVRGKYNYAEKNNFFQKDIAGYTPTTTNPYTSHSPTGYINSSFGARLNYQANEQNSFYFDTDFGFQRLGTLNTSSSAIPIVKDYFKFNYILNHDGDYSFGRFNSFLHYADTSMLPHYTPGYTPTGQTTFTKALENGRESGKRDHQSLIWNPAFTYQTTFTKDFLFGDFGGLILNAGPYFFYERLYKRGGNFDTRIKAFDNDSYQVALFGEGELFLGDISSLTAGVRANYVQTFGVFASPRAYLNFFPTSWLTFKAGVASGLQVPQLSQRYDGYYADYASRGTNQQLYGNANLVPEKSLNYEISSIIDTPAMNFTLTGFITDFTDAITSQTYQNGVTMPYYGVCSAGNNNTCSLPINEDKARIYGGEFGLKSTKMLADLTTGFYFDLAYAYTKTERKSGKDKGKPLNRVPEHNLSAKLSYKKTKWDTYVRYVGKYRTPAFGAHAANVGPGEYFKDTHIVDLGLDYKTGDKITLGFVVNNLFDFDTIDYFTYQSGTRTSYSNSYQRMIAGRNYWLNIRAEF